MTLKPGDRVMQKGTVESVGKGFVQILWNGEGNETALYDKDGLDGIEKCEEPAVSKVVAYGQTLETQKDALKREILEEIADAIQDAEPYDVTEKIYYNLLKRAGKL